MLYRFKKGILKPWHITQLCTTSDSNHTRPCSTAPIILRICYDILMLTVCPGFIIMTSLPHKSSADPIEARGQTNGITMESQLAHSSSWPRSRSSMRFKNMKQYFCLLVGTWSPAIAKYPITVCQGALAAFITLSQIDVQCFSWSLLFHLREHTVVMAP